MQPSRLHVPMNIALGMIATAMSKAAGDAFARKLCIGNVRRALRSRKCDNKRLHLRRMAAITYGVGTYPTNNHMGISINLLI